MARNSRKQKVSEQTRDEAMKIARGTQRPGQTKEQTRLIAQGIQKGIDQYKKQQKAKARELDKKLKKVSAAAPASAYPEPVNQQPVIEQQPSSMGALPWVLLVLSWIGFAIYLLMPE